MYTPQASRACFESLFHRFVPPEVGEKMHLLRVWVTVSCRGIFIVKCRRKQLNLLYSDIRTTVQDALYTLRMHMPIHPNYEDQGLLNLHKKSICFVGGMRLKQRTNRILLRGQPWTELPSSTLLIDLSKLKDGILLAPYTHLLSTASSTARCVCTSYLLLLQKKNIIVNFASYSQSKQTLSLFGPHNISVFE